MTKTRISDYDEALCKIVETYPDQELYINVCKEAGIELSLIHSIVSQKIELLEFIGNDEYLIGLYKELEELFPNSKILEILKAHIKIKEIIANNGNILTAQTIETLNSSIIRSPELLKKLEKHIAEMDLAA